MWTSKMFSQTSCHDSVEARSEVPVQCVLFSVFCQKEKFVLHCAKGQIEQHNKVDLLGKNKMA